MIERPDADRGVLVPDPPLESNGYAPISRGTGEEIWIGPGGALRGMAMKWLS